MPPDRGTLSDGEFSAVVLICESLFWQ